MVVFTRDRVCKGRKTGETNTKCIIHNLANRNTNNTTLQSMFIIIIKSKIANNLINY